MVSFVSKLMRPKRGVRRVNVAENHVSFTGWLPWFDLDHLMDPGAAAPGVEGILEVESMLEHDFLVVLRQDRTVQMVRQQPRWLRWWDPAANEWRSYVPDFEVIRSRSSNATFVEVKYSKDLVESDLKLIGAAFERLGHRHEVWTEREIRRQPRLRNCLMLYGATGPLEDPDALDAVRRVVRSAAPNVLTIGEIREAAGVGGAAFRAILRLHVRGEVLLDLDSPIDDGALVAPLAALR